MTHRSSSFSTVLFLGAQIRNTSIASTPSDTLGHFVNVIDKSMRSCLGCICQDNISDASWMQVVLPFSIGGLGMIHIARACSRASFWSAEFSSCEVSDLAPETSCLSGPDPAIDPHIITTIPSWLPSPLQPTTGADSGQTRPPASPGRQSSIADWL
jgi:hypothetical protein